MAASLAVSETELLASLEDIERSEVGSLEHALRERLRADATLLEEVA